MKAKRKQLENALGQFAMNAILRRLSGKTPEQAEEIGARMGRLLGQFGKKRMEVAVSNLRMAMPELPDPEGVARRVFENFGRTAGDFLTLHERSSSQIIDSMEVIGREHFDWCVDQGKGVILITGHYGNWERMGAYVGSLGYTVSVVARDADQQGVTGRVNQIREKAGVKVISRGNAARPMLEALRRNELIGILPDQNSSEIFIPFFGKPAGTVLGPGVLHERTGAPVLFVYCYRVAPARYALQIRPPLHAEPTEVRGEAMMRVIHSELEMAIRAHPDQWLWFHDRWRNARRRGLL